MKFFETIPRQYFKVKENSKKGNCLFESVRDGLNEQYKLRGSGPKYSEKVLRQMVCDFYKILFAAARKDTNGNYLMKDGSFDFDRRELRQIKASYMVNDTLWENLLIYLSVTDEFHDNEFDEKDLKKMNLGELKALAEEHDIELNTEKRITRDILIEALLEYGPLIYHFDNICKDKVWAGITDIIILSIVCKINILCYADDTNYREGAWFSNSCPTVLLSYIDEAHYRALLPKSRDFLQHIVYFGASNRRKLCHNVYTP
jgi:hypothetical protein